MLDSCCRQTTRRTWSAPFADCRTGVGVVVGDGGGRQGGLAASWGWGLAGCGHAAAVVVVVVGLAAGVRRAAGSRSVAAAKSAGAPLVCRSVAAVLVQACSLIRVSTSRSRIGFSLRPAIAQLSV